jgi:hypothetical protein
MKTCLMNQEWAVDPACVERHSDFSLLASHLGFTEGVFLSKFPSNWLSLAFQRAEVLCEPQKTKVREVLRRIKESASLLPSGRGYDGQRNWGVNACDQHEVLPFDRLMSTSSTQHFTDISAIDEFDWSSAREARTAGSLKTIIEILQPLIRLSYNIILVDPYFAPQRKGNRDLFKSVVDMAFSNKCREFKFFVRTVNWPYIENQCEGELRKLLGRYSHGSKKISVVCFDDSGCEHKQHARYIFSELGGLRLDKGLQIDESLVDFSTIGRVTHDELLKFFVQRPLAMKVDYRADFCF